MDCRWSICALLMQHSRIFLEKHSWIAHEAFVHFSSTRVCEIIKRFSQDLYTVKKKIFIKKNINSFYYSSVEREKNLVSHRLENKGACLQKNFLHSNIFSAPNNWISAAAGNWSWFGLVWLGLVSIKRWVGTVLDFTVWWNNWLLDWCNSWRYVWSLCNRDGCLDVAVMKSVGSVPDKVAKAELYLTKPHVILSMFDNRSIVLITDTTVYVRSL